MKDTVARKFSSTNALTVFLSVSSAVAIMLALLGYGVALSAEASFGVPHAIIFNSTSDLLTLGGWAVMQMLSYLGKLQQWDFYADVWLKFWAKVQPLLVVVVVAFVVGASAFLARSLARRSSWVRRRQAQLRASISEHGRLARMVAFPVLVLLGIAIAWPVAMVATLFGLALFGCFLGIVPLTGFAAGKGHIDDWVVGPKICIPLRSRDARLQTGEAKNLEAGERPRAASCVAVKKSDGKEYRGRVVFATFNAVVLFDPDAGTVQRVSTDGASVEVIEKL